MYKEGKYGKVFYMKTNLSKDEKFGALHEINSNFENLSTLQLSNNHAMGINERCEVVEWKCNKSETNLNKQNFDYLLTQPIYHFYKMKFLRILINSNVCLALETNGGVLVWGCHKDGLLGLGFSTTKVENPTKLENLKNITEMSMSEEHAAVININGEAYSWGSGKYGELGHEKIIYSPFPSKISTKKTYSKVFCSNLLTCFIDKNGKFSYFGIIIKILKGNYSSITLMNLLNDENNSDPFYLFQEKSIYELGLETFKNIAIGNGFIGLLSDKGLVYAIDYSDNITLLYSKYYVYSISVSNNQLYGLCRDNTLIDFPKDNISKDVSMSHNCLNNLGEILEKYPNYFMCRWIAGYVEKDQVSDNWTTSLYKIMDSNFIGNIKFIESKNMDILIILQSNDEDYSIGKMSVSTVNMPSPMNKNCALFPQYNEEGELSMSKKISSKKTIIEVLYFVCSFDDSYNMKYKRMKNFQGARAIPSNTSQNFNKISLDENLATNRIQNVNSLIFSNFSYNDLEINDNNGLKDKPNNCYNYGTQDNDYNNEVEAEIRNNELLTFKSNQDLRADHLDKNRTDNNEFSQIKVMNQAKYAFDPMNESIINILNNYHTAENKITIVDTSSSTEKLKHFSQNFHKDSSHYPKSKYIKKNINSNGKFSDVVKKVFNSFSNKICSATTQYKRYNCQSDNEFEQEQHKINEDSNDTISKENNFDINNSYLNLDKKPNVSFVQRKNNLCNKIESIDDTQQYPINNKTEFILDYKFDNKAISIIEKDYTNSHLDTPILNNNPNHTLLSDNDFQLVEENLENNNQSLNTFESPKSNSYRRKKPYDSKKNINSNVEINNLISKNYLNLIPAFDTHITERKINCISGEGEIDFSIINPKLVIRQISDDNISLLNNDFRHSIKNSTIKLSPCSKLFKKENNDSKSYANESLVKDTDVKSDQEENVATMLQPIISCHNSLSQVITGSPNKKNLDNNLIENIMNINPISKSKAFNQAYGFGAIDEDTLIYSTSFNSNSSNNFLKNFLHLNNKCSLFMKILSKKFFSFFFKLVWIHINEKELEESVDSDEKREEKSTDHHNAIQAVELNLYNLNKIKDNKEILFVSKIIFKVFSLHFKNERNILSKGVFNNIKEHSISIRKDFLLKKIVHWNIKKNSQIYYAKWKLITSIFKAVRNLDKLYLNNLNYFFSIFKHQSRIYTIKKKYFEEFISLMDKKCVLNITKTFFPIFIKRVFYQVNFDKIQNNFDKIESIIYMKSVQVFLKKLKKISVIKKLLIRNFEYLFKILNRKIFEIKKNLFQYFIQYVTRLKILSNLFVRKNNHRLQIMKKIFTNFKNFALSKDEILFIKIKMKKVFKIYQYKLKMNVLKMLYRWNNIATKRWKPNMKKCLMSAQQPKYKINDFRGKLGVRKLSGSNLSSPAQTQENSEKLLKSVSSHIIARLNSIKLEFLGRLSLNVIAKNLDAFIMAISKLFIRKHFTNLIERMSYEQIDTSFYEQDRENNLRYNDEISEIRDSQKINGMTVYNITKESNNNPLYTNSDVSNRIISVSNLNSRKNTSLNKSLNSESQTQKTFIYKLNDNSLQSQLENSSDLNLNFLNTTYYNSDNRRNNAIRNELKESGELKDLRSNFQMTVDKADLSLRNNDNIEYFNNNNINLQNFNLDKINQKKIATPKFDNIEHAITNTEKKIVQIPPNRHKKSPTVIPCLPKSVRTGSNLDTKTNNNMQMNKTMLLSKAKNSDQKVASGNKTKLNRVESTKSLKSKHILVSYEDTKIKTEPRAKVKHIIFQNKVESIKNSSSNRFIKRQREIPFSQQTYRTIFDNKFDKIRMNLTSDRTNNNKSTYATYDTRGENPDRGLLYSLISERAKRDENKFNKLNTFIANTTVNNHNAFKPLNNEDVCDDESRKSNGRIENSNLCINTKRIVYRDMNRLMILMEALQLQLDENKKDLSFILFRHLKIKAMLEKNKMRVYAIRILSKTFMRREYFFKLKLFYSRI